MTMVRARIDRMSFMSPPFRFAGSRLQRLYFPQIADKAFRQFREKYQNKTFPPLAAGMFYSPK
jgi:hypothetical protein